MVVIAFGPGEFGSHSRLSTLHQESQVFFRNVVRAFVASRYSLQAANQRCAVGQVSWVHRARGECILLFKEMPPLQGDRVTSDHPKALL